MHLQRNTVFQEQQEKKAAYLSLVAKTYETNFYPKLSLISLNHTNEPLNETIDDDLTVQTGANLHHARRTSTTNLKMSFLS